MPQLDFGSWFNQVFVVVIVIFVFYYVSLFYHLPVSFSIFKMRGKIFKTHKISLPLIFLVTDFYFKEIIENFLITALADLLILSYYLTNNELHIIKAWLLTNSTISTDFIELVLQQKLLFALIKN